MTRPHESPERAAAGHAGPRRRAPLGCDRHQPRRDRVHARRPGDVTHDSHLIVPYGGPVYANYFAADIGCVVVQPAISAVDLHSLCRSSGSTAPPMGSPVASP